MTDAGYSGTPLPRKLGIKEGTTLHFVNPPDDFAITLGELPAGTRLASEHLDVLIFFAREGQQLLSELPALMESVSTRGGLWIAWPKKASKVQTDITEDRLREWILPTGWVDNKVCSIDATWSGLRFVRRK